MLKFAFPFFIVFYKNYDNITFYSKYDFSESKKEIMDTLATEGSECYYMPLDFDFSKRVTKKRIREGALQRILTSDLLLI